MPQGEPGGGKEKDCGSALFHMATSPNDAGRWSEAACNDVSSKFAHI